jgi:hypothetical protein
MMWLFVAHNEYSIHFCVRWRREKENRTDLIAANVTPQFQFFVVLHTVVISWGSISHLVNLVKSE